MKNRSVVERIRKITGACKAPSELMCTLCCTVLLVAQACGGNVTEKYAPDNDLEKAELSMERGQFTQASERIEKVLQDDPNNRPARSLLAAAYAAQAGITTLGLIKGATQASAASGTAIDKFNGILPDVTTETLDLMDNACSQMELIPANELTTEMSLQQSLFYSAYAFLQIKFFVTNTEALAALTISDATRLVLTLAKAVGSGGNSPLSTLASTVSTSISAAPGDNLDKVKLVLGASTP